MIKAAAALALLLTAGCVYPPFGPMGAPMSSPSFQQVKEEFSSNGEMIFYTGVNQKGQRIPFTGGPHWIYMHGGACVSCHGMDGRGGSIPHMCSVVAPSITYHDLTKGEPEEHEEHPPYTDEDIKNAITRGIDPAGEQLDPCMPRWKLSEQDLNDLLEYLKTLE
jgi:mono/diheme cytochrome c family protein